MPEYGPANEDRNVEHARNLLNASKDMDLPEPARELAWACNTLSYAERERTKEMVDRVREFYAKYPFSRRFLQKMIQPVIEVQASQLSDFIAKNDPYSATQFFETSRDILFKSMTDQLRKDLFIAYMDIYNAKAAKEFLDAYVRTEPQSMLKDIRLAAFYAETQDSKSGKVSKQQTEAARRLLASDMSQKRASLESLYLNRIKSTPAASLNLPWIYRLETAWAKDDEKLVCSHVFPTLARIFDEESSLWDASVRRQEVEAFVSKQLPEMFRKDEGCAISIMEFEYEVFKSRPLELAALYGERESWPMLEDIVSLFWSLAEQLKEIGEHEKARNIFQIIAEKGPQTSSKVRFAKLRLDKSKTEFEKLWE
jgi:hypothetical protein